MSPVARKGSKKAAKPEPPSSSTANPTTKSEPDNCDASVNADTKDEEKLVMPTDNKIPNECANIEKDMTICPNGGLSDNFPDIWQSDYWNWMFLPSNITTEPSKNAPCSHISMPYCGIGLDGASGASGASKAKSKTKPKKSNGGAFTAADLERYLFPVIHESEEAGNVFPSSVAQSVQQARTEKLVKFFKDNINDKHFVNIPVEPLRGNENWREWLVAMQLLFIQHGIWHVVAKDTKPLPESHPLSLWYLRMRDTAVGLIYANVSDTVRKHDCFLNAASENDPNAMMSHLDAHYGMPDEDYSHVHTGFSSQRK